MLSESQERMLLVAEKGREQEVLDVFKKWGLDCAEVGIVTADDVMRVLHHGELVAEIPNKALTDEAPVYHRAVGTWEPPVPRDPPAWVLEELKKPRDYTADLKKLLASANICSKKWIYEQYDSMVQTNTVQGPGGEAGVMRIKGTGAEGQERGLAMALAGNGRWCYLDPKLGAMHAVAEAARKVACTGATPVAATNCLNFGNPQKPEIMAQLSAAIDGIAEACNALGTPVTGGNVSLYNETLGEGIYPTPVIGIVGILDDVTKAVPSGFQRVGDHIILAQFNRWTDGWQGQLGSSEFAKAMFDKLWGVPPLCNLEAESALISLLGDLASKGLVHSMCDVGSGGLAVALAKACLSGGLGVVAEHHQPDFKGPLDAYFFEEPGTVVISCTPENADRVIKLIEAQSPLYVAAPIGKVTGSSFELQFDGEVFISEEIAEILLPWSTALHSKLAEEVSA
jgi:phosphoribosylformylglycinamidine synthase